MVRRVTLFGVLTIALPCVGVGALIVPARASARCENSHVAYPGQFFFEIAATKLRKISCKEALKIGKPLYHAKVTLPAKYFPPPSAGVFGVPGGQGKRSACRRRPDTSRATSRSDSATRLPRTAIAASTART